MSIIIGIILGAAVAYFLLMHFHLIPSGDKKPVIPADQIVIRMLNELNCKFEQKGEDDKKEFRFTFQNGRFIIMTTVNSALISVVHSTIYQSPRENVGAADYLCNILNADDNLPVSFYTFDENKNQILVHCKEMFYLDQHDAELFQRFQTLLSSSFSFERLFAEQFEKLIGINDETPGETVMNMSREQFLLKEQEFSHQSNDLQWRLNETQRLTLGQFLLTLFDLHDLIKVRLTVVTDQLETVDDTAASLSFDLLSKMVSEEPAVVRDEMTLIVSYADVTTKGKMNTLTLLIKKDGESDRSVYFRLSVCQPALAIDRSNSWFSDRNKIHAYTVVVAYDRASNEKKLAEFNYMWSDAKDKVDNNQRKELSEEQSLLFDCLYPNIGYNLYWGKSLFLDKRYYEALLHLENAYSYLQTQYQSMSDRYKRFFFELCYYIGFCYVELQQYSRAYYYLDTVYQLNNINYGEEYVNCLVNSKDFRAIDVINDALERIRKMEEEADEEEGVGEVLISFKNFLRRRKAYVLIDIGKIDEATQLFTEMLDEPENRDFALNELAFIQKQNHSQPTAPESK